MDILFNDNHILAVNKPPGILVQGDSTGDESLFKHAKHFIKQEYNKPGNVYLALLHRIDRPASGVVLFARTSKAAGRLSQQLRENQMQKIYYALLEGKVKENGKFVDYIMRRQVTSYISPTSNEGKYSTLIYERKTIINNQSLVKIKLQTGRHHQIRVQFSHRSYPIVGDFRYGSTCKFPERSIALHARSIEFHHPTLGKKITITADFPSNWNTYMKTGDTDWKRFL